VVIYFGKEYLGVSIIFFSFFFILKLVCKLIEDDQLMLFLVMISSPLLRTQGRGNMRIIGHLGK